MKKLFIIVMMALGVLTANNVSAQWNEMLLNSGNQGKAQLTTTKAAAIKWDKTEFDFGDIKQGIPQKAEFTFENISDKIIIIEKAEASCGCTKLTYNHEPIKPGEKGTVSTIFDAKELGLFQKSVTVFFSIEAPHNVYELKFTGSVVE